MVILNRLPMKKAALMLSLPAVAVLSFQIMALAAKPAGMIAQSTVPLVGAPIHYRLSGEYLAGHTPSDAPLEVLSKTADLDIMKFQVSEIEYASCVQAQGCDRADAPAGGAGNVAQTGVSYDDAAAYAKWLSAKTGEFWRLPTDGEWALAAGSLYTDDALGIASDPDNPSVRWLAVYRREARQTADPDPAIHLQGASGINENGIADLNDNVWEWTSTCFQRVSLGTNGEVLDQSENCGVKTIEGKHRSYLTSFLRQGKDGGCSTGSPPDHLGFRLVREKNVSLARKLAAMMDRLIN